MIDRDYDWERFWIHFVFGAVLGAATGLMIWLRSWHSGLSVWLCVGGYSFAVALLGGIYGDRFWTWFLENLRWLRWW